MVEYSKCKIDRYTTEKGKDCLQKKNRNNFDNEFKNVWWKIIYHMNYCRLQGKKRS